MVYLLFFLMVTLMILVGATWMGLRAERVGPDLIRDTFARRPDKP